MQVLKLRSALSVPAVCTCLLAEKESAEAIVSMLRTAFLQFSAEIGYAAGSFLKWGLMTEVQFSLQIHLAPQQQLGQETHSLPQIPCSECAYLQSATPTSICKLWGNVIGFQSAPSAFSTPTQAFPRPGLPPALTKSGAPAATLVLPQPQLGFVSQQHSHRKLLNTARTQTGREAAHCV